MRVGIQNLGCKVNSYESNSLRELFLSHGYEIVKHTDFADVYVINTCSVTNTADSKSRKSIRQAIRRNEKAIICVMGCYSQTKPNDILDIDGVDIIIGSIGKENLPNLIEDVKRNKKQIFSVKDISKDTEFDNLNSVSFETTRAFIKIQDGCENFCSYCIIPYSRGNVRSKKFKDVISQTKMIIEKGYKEIVLTGIHTGSYLDKETNMNLDDLVEAMLNIDGVYRLRISSIEINEVSDRLIDLMINNDNFVSHLHLPLQSADDNILKSMNRKYDLKYFDERLEYIRSQVDDISITTDLILGYPGETKDIFNNIKENIQKFKFNDMHIFPYSKRDGTPAASMNNQVDDKVKSSRVFEMKVINNDIKNNLTKSYLNKSFNMLIENIINDFAVGYTENYLLVHIKNNNYSRNQIVNVLIHEVLNDKIIVRIK